jgi:hypothetical protein
VSALLIAVMVSFAALGFAALFVLARLSRALRWEQVDDDRLHHELSTTRGWAMLRGWFTPRHRLLTYRRDALGRFRRHRR